jgi:ferritin-like metal-binding protein YciE
MEIESLEHLYIAELQELASVERQLAECLARVAKSASHPALRNTLLDHREETERQNDRLESILEKRGANPSEHTDQAMQALVNETEKTLPMLKSDELRDAGIIASMQRLKHYEIAAYGTVTALAGHLNLLDDQRMLHESLEEEKEADLSLTVLAESEINPDALSDRGATLAPM